MFIKSAPCALPPSEHPVPVSGPRPAAAAFTSSSSLSAPCAQPSHEQPSSASGPRPAAIPYLPKPVRGAALKGLSLFLLTGALLFGSAGTLNYPHAWLFLALTLVPLLALGTALLCKAPDLLSAPGIEAHSVQPGVIASSGIWFVCAFVLAAMDDRIGWTKVPAWLVAAASVLYVLAFALLAESVYESAALARRHALFPLRPVRIAGPYRVVRHPIYAATVVQFLSVPLILGSFVALAVMLLYPLLVAVRIGAEERRLERSWTDYAAYTQRVRYRLIPFIW